MRRRWLAGWPATKNRWSIYRVQATAVTGRGCISEAEEHILWPHDPSAACTYSWRIRQRVAAFPRECVCVRSQHMHRRNRQHNPTIVDDGRAVGILKPLGLATVWGVRLLLLLLLAVLLCERELLGCTEREAISRLPFPPELGLVKGDRFLQWCATVCRMVRTRACVVCMKCASADHSLALYLSAAAHLRKCGQKGRNRH